MYLHSLFEVNAGSFFIFFSQKLISSCFFNQARVGNGAGWDEICQSQSRSVYASGMKRRSTSIPIFVFGIKIYPNLVPKEMGTYGIPALLEKFSFLVSNETWWEEICQSHFCPVYASELKKNVILPSLNFFIG